MIIIREMLYEILYDCAKEFGDFEGQLRVRIPVAKSSKKNKRNIFLYQQPRQKKQGEIGKINKKIERLRLDLINN